MYSFFEKYFSKLTERKLLFFCRFYLKELISISIYQIEGWNKYKIVDDFLDGEKTLSDVAFAVYLYSHLGKNSLKENMAIYACKLFEDIEKKYKSRHINDLYAFLNKQTLFLNDIMPDVNFNKEILTWNNNLIYKLAKEIYQTQNYEGMKVLGDAFQDAGLTNQEIINNCYSEKQHFKGNFVIEGILNAAIIQ